MKKKRAGFGMREKLMLAMCGISFLVLGVLRFATTSLLQPTYNHFIYESLEQRLDAFTALFDEAYQNGQEISRRDLFGLQLNTEFWSGVNQVLSDGEIQVSDCCVISRIPPCAA